MNTGCTAFSRSRSLSGKSTWAAPRIQGLGLGWRCAAMLNASQAAADDVPRPWIRGPSGRPRRSDCRVTKAPTMLRHRRRLRSLHAHLLDRCSPCSFPGQAPGARMALRRDAGSIASGGRRRPKALKTRPCGSTQEARLPRREGANDAQASPAPPLLTLAPPGSMQPMFIPRTGSRR